MNETEFDKAKKVAYYDEFMKTCLSFDGLSMEDYAEFMPKVLPVILLREEKDPIVLFEKVIEDLAEKWTASEELPFHGPWHHGIIPAVIITALKNNQYKFSEKDCKEAFIRGVKIPAGACGFCGVCGAGTGLGIAMSIIQRATPFQDETRSKAFKAANKSNERIGKLGGPRCCRLSAYMTIGLAVETLKEIDYNLPQAKLIGRCAVHEKNAQCHGKRCPYYPRKGKN